MERLKVNVPAPSASRGSPPERGTALRSLSLTDPLPKISNRSTDVDIPNRVWSAWSEQGKTKLLRRGLTVDERSALEARRDELAPALAPFLRSQREAAMIAVADMFASYRSMRQTDEDAMGTLEATLRSLSGYPLWAVEKACRSIQTDGVWRNGKFDRQWPPNDPEIVEAVRKECQVYRGQHDSAVALLSATVEGK